MWKNAECNDMVGGEEKETTDFLPHGIAIIVLTLQVQVDRRPDEANIRITRGMSSLLVWYSSIE